MNEPHTPGAVRLAQLPAVRHTIEIELRRTTKWPRCRLRSVSVYVPGRSGREDASTSSELWRAVAAIVPAA